MEEKNPERIVHWSTIDNLPDPRNWVELPDTGLPATPLDASLRLPGGTISALEVALANGWTRSTGWRPAPNASPETAKAWQAAASVFKRGVRCGSDVEAPGTSGSYRVHFAKSRPVLDPEAFLVCDAQVAALWGLDNARGSSIYPEEERKSLKTVAEIIDQWHQQGQPPHWQVVGGGITGDLGGFAASLSGCSFELLPTTLLAMADSSIGGKTGVNHHRFGKNLIGRFHFPSQVTIWTGWLETLDQRHLRAGAMECLKHSLLQPDLNDARAVAQIFNGRSLEAISELLPASIDTKSRIVQQDPQERGLRAILNLGHTLGHALEAVVLSKKQALLHGEAVGVGLVFALLLSREAGFLTAGECDQMLELLQTSNCLLSRSEWLSIGEGVFADPGMFDQLWRHMASDKKATEHHAPNWILLEGIGRPVEPSAGCYLVPVDRAVCQRTWGLLLEALPESFSGASG